MKTRIPEKQNGFTLLEIIVTILLAAILAAILSLYMDTSLSQSAKPILQIQHSLSLSQVMENMTADYKKLMATDSDPLANFKTDIEEGNDSEKTPYYGEYTITAQYIEFSSGAEVPDSSGNNRTLKVTITAGGQTTTALFTK